MKVTTLSTDIGRLLVLLLGIPVLFGCENETIEDTSTAFRFMPPAYQMDFPEDTVKQAALISLWNVNLNGFTEQGQLGDPWNAINMDNITHYFNPSVTSPAEAAVADIIWGALPGRVAFYFENLPEEDQLSISDRGLLANGDQPPLIPNDPCDLTNGATRVFGPYGPRGFQDEYSEWSVQRDANGVITRIDFTCENPEYWNTLWIIDPEKALSIYQSTLNYATITMDDLILHDAAGNKVLDPSTGGYVYNPLNKYNNGSGGAMHLTSTPNTLQTEIGLATSSTLQRKSGNANEDELICCGTFGQNYRNSDPHIGGSVNRVVEAGFQVTLTNPPGLYIQMPNFSQYVTPDGTDASEFWTIVRGKEKAVDEYGHELPGNYILHATFEVPASKGYKVGDITIAGKKINWGSQISATYNMQIVASALPMAAPAEEPCSGTPATSTPDPQQLFHASVFDAMHGHTVANPMKQYMNLLSNSTFIAPKVAQGASNVPMVLTTDALNFELGNPVITFDDPSITAAYVRHDTVSYAVPGNSYPSNSIAVYFNVAVGAQAGLGTHSVQLSNQGQNPGPAMPALLNVVESINQ
ncbi:MAG: hypothetical protein KDC34_14930 [Saprospiraceae bacterium]|nr:hypothetical protein [Saprospiraceae bacterium]